MHPGYKEAKVMPVFSCRRLHRRASESMGMGMEQRAGGAQRAPEWSSKVDETTRVHVPLSRTLCMRDSLVELAHGQHVADFGVLVRLSSVKLAPIHHGLHAL